MAYDEELAERIREALAATRGVTEQKMFGGLGFMVNGNMCLAASSNGGMLMRMDPGDGAALVAKDANVRPMEMRGRAMTGFLFVDAKAVKTAAGMKKYAAIALATVAAMPPKTAKKKMTAARKPRSR